MMATPNTTDILLVDTTDRIRTLTFNRPESRNALSSALRSRFFAALRDAGGRRRRGRRDRHRRRPGVLRRAGSLRNSAPPPNCPTYPQVAADEQAGDRGDKRSRGDRWAELALYCDILIASDRARFADTHARVGLLPTWGLSVRLPQKVGVGMARRMSLTGDYLSADDALRAGLVTEVVAHDELLPTARAVAASIVGNNQKSVRALLASYHRIDEAGTSTGLWLEAEAARAWMRSATGDDIAASRASVIERGRAQVK